MTLAYTFLAGAQPNAFLQPMHNPKFWSHFLVFISFPRGSTLQKMPKQVFNCQKNQQPQDDQIAQKCIVENYVLSVDPIITQPYLFNLSIQKSVHCTSWCFFFFKIRTPQTYPIENMALNTQLVQTSRQFHQSDLIMLIDCELSLCEYLNSAYTT